MKTKYIRPYLNQEKEKKRKSQMKSQTEKGDIKRENRYIKKSLEIIVNRHEATYSTV